MGSLRYVGYRVEVIAGACVPPGARLRKADRKGRTVRPFAMELGAMTFPVLTPERRARMPFCSRRAVLVGMAKKGIWV